MIAHLVLAAVATIAAPVRPHADHVTIVVMENRNYGSVVDNPHAPYFNGTLVPQGALLTDSHAIEHPSQPNYLDLFSGSNQGVSDDSCPHTFSSANIASRLFEKHRTFASYSESMPADGFTACRFARIYARKHAPWTNFTSVPAEANRVYTGFPADPPSLAWIIPNMCNDMHDCSTRTGDDWMRTNLPPIIAWNAKHNGLLIVTWDESDFDLTNHIATLFIGPMIEPRRRHAQRVSHFDVLHTIETIFGVACIARECRAGDVTGIWR